MRNTLVLGFLCVGCMGCTPRSFRGGNQGQVQATTDRGILPWPSGIMRFTTEIDDEEPSPNLLAELDAAIKAINDLGVVRIEKHDGDYATHPIVAIIRFGGTQCSSAIGYDPERSRMIRLGEDCHKGIIMHELLHTLGLVHEQVHPRSGLQLRLARIETSMEDQFVSESALALSEYDPDSIMHYSSHDFTICNNLNDPKWTDATLANELPNLVCRNKDWKSVSSPVDCKFECAVLLQPNGNLIEKQRDFLSPRDLEGLRALYRGT